MAQQKPLPALPTISGLTTLSSDSRNHRSLLIRHFFADIPEPGLDSRRDGWVSIFEDALDALGSYLNRGDVLTSVKKAKEMKKNTAKEEYSKGSKLAGSETESKEQEGNNISKPLPSDPIPPFKQLLALAARPPVPIGEKRTSHLLICVAPHGSRVPLPAEDNGFEILPSNIDCVFTSGSFALQEEEIGDHTILFGLDGLDGNILDPNVRLAGGTFTFRGVTSPVQHKLLSKVLRLAIYVHLSLILEQHFLSNSGVELKFLRPKIPQPSPSTPTNPHSNESQTEQVKEASRAKARNSLMPSSFTNFFLRRGFSHRAHTVNPSGNRGGSLDLTVLPPPSPITGAPTESSRGDGLGAAVSHFRLRRLSLLGERASIFKPSVPTPPTQQLKLPNSQPMTSTLKLIEQSAGLLSTSPGVTLALPKLLVDLAEKEKAKANLTNNPECGPRRRLKGDERAALTSLLGWDGKDAEGKGMSGILGFTRHQEISFLFSSHVPFSVDSLATSTINSIPSIATSSSTKDKIITPTHEGSSAFTTSTTATVSTTATSATSISPSSGLSPCEKPHWVTYQYYSSDGGDLHLGEWVHDCTSRRNLPCLRNGCKFLKGQHEERIVHNGIRISVKLTPEDVIFEDSKEEEGEKEEKHEDEGAIKVWESCADCGAKTAKRTMDDGTYLLSFAKFVELLIYSPFICTITPPLCEHTTPPSEFSSSSPSSLPSSRLNIVRHFSSSSGKLSLSLSVIEDIFEIRVPRLQITRGVEKGCAPMMTSGLEGGPSKVPEGDLKKNLRREIRIWWEGISNHIDKIEGLLMDEPLKTLPRLPSDDPYDMFESIPKPYLTAPLPSLPPSTPVSPTQEFDVEGSYFTVISEASVETQASKTPTVPPKDNSDLLLSALRHNFQKIEQSLYTQLAQTPESSLNDVRRSFLGTGHGALKRLKAWQKKHLGPVKSKALGEILAVEPEWWGKGFHAVPGGNIIVRENDWGSIISHTLSTSDYQLELANMTAIRPGTPSQPKTPTTVSEGSPISLFSVATGYKLFTSSSKNQPDPDQEDIVWNEPERYSAVISRMHARDPTSLLSIRDVLRQKATPDIPSGAATPSRFSSISTATAGGQQVGSCSSTLKGKADVSLGMSLEAADGMLRVNGPIPGRIESPGLLLLHELEKPTPSGTISRPSSIRSQISSEVVIDTKVTRVKDSPAVLGDSAGSIDSHESHSTVGKGKSKETQHANEPSTESSDLAAPPPLPPKDSLKLKSSESDNNTLKVPVFNSPLPPPPTSSGFANAVANGVNAAMRFVLNSEPPSRSLSPAGSNAKNHHVLLADIAGVDERPHIRYDWTIGKRLKFSCTVYYAKQFDVLRRRCGISDSFLKSLSKGANWAAEGGKSKSNFWKTCDDRYIIKTLVNAWNVADLQVLVELAPSYFRYMDATASRATVLAKLIGFYTIEIKNLETGNVQSKVDLLVMENLFFGQNISKTFDLKGIQGRKVKLHGTTTKTMFDGEWIEGLQRTLTLLRPHSKVILREAIKNDAEFLSKSNIMDYSLLLGVDNEKKEIACGLVDTIGSYTFAKTLEYKAKHGLQSGKEITVVPPTEYQERFVKALEDYFVACPDKWSKPLDESKIISNPDLLPSVL